MMDEQNNLNQAENPNQNSSNEPGTSGTNSESASINLEKNYGEPQPSSGGDSLFDSTLNLGFVRQKVNATRQEIGNFVIGQQTMVDLLLISIFRTDMCC